MDEYINRDKLNELIDREIEVCNSGMIRGELEYLKAIVPIAADVISRATFEQVMWERDVAIQQLKDLGVGFGEKADVAPKWISVEERLPEPEREVLVQCETRPHNFKYQCIAIYIPEKWYREDSDFNWDWECCDKYDEEADDYYVDEGWYECIRNWDDYNVVGIGDFVTHWLPLPEPPKGKDENDA